MRLFLGLLVIWGGLLMSGLSYPHGSQTSIPPAPTARSQRFGIYNWNIDDRAYDSANHDRLNWGADRVAAIGSSSIRVFLGPRDIYHLKMQGPASATNLAQLAASPAYDRLFRDSRFSTYLLTTYTYFGQQNRWADGFTDAEYDGERAEIQALGEYLLSNAAFAGKTFILINWEGDNEMVGLADKQSSWDAYRRATAARVEAVRSARVLSQSQDVKLFSGVEFNLVRSNRTNQPCGAPVTDPVNQDPLGNRCVIDYIAPYVSADYYSYSSWQSVTTVYINPAMSLVTELRTDVRAAHAIVKAIRPEVSEANFILGEYGFERARFGECRAADLINQLFAAMEGPGGLGVSYAILWQIVDNANLFGVIDDRFGALRTVADGSGFKLALTLPGSTLQKRIAGETATLPAECPGIAKPPQSWGVVDAATGMPQFRLDPDSILSIASDASFSASGNTVQFAQAALKTDLTVANGGLIDESASRITAKMPHVRRPGEAWVYVSNASSMGSNAQIINLECASCPKIDNTCGIVDRAFQTANFEPGTVISVRGVFSPQGNSVVVEQQLEGTVRVLTTLPHDINWSESTSEITATLPSDLVRNSDASVSVIDNLGRYSASMPIFVPLPCVDCGPTISSCPNNPGSVAQAFHPGTILSISGEYRKTGNHVVIEQRDQQGSVTKYDLSAGARGWKETLSRIEVGLPAQIQPGRTLVYVVDSMGKESKAGVLKVTPATMALVSAASFRPSGATPGGIVAAFGNSLATATAAAATIPLPTALAGTSVRITDSAGAELAAPLFFASQGQVNFQIPDTAALGPAMVTVTSGDGTLSQLSTNIVSVAPGIFAANADAVGAPAGTFIHVAADSSQVSESTATIDLTTGRYIPAKVQYGPQPENLFLILYGTGFRRLSSQSAVQVKVGGSASQVTYAGLQDGFAGLDQINAILPRTLTGRGVVEVEVIIDGHSANVLQLYFK